jgi:hypothetical protein
MHISVKPKEGLQNVKKLELYLDCVIFVLLLAEKMERDKHAQPLSDCHSVHRRE